MGGWGPGRRVRTSSIQTVLPPPSPTKPPKNFPPSVGWYMLPDDGPPFRAVVRQRANARVVVDNRIVLFSVNACFAAGFFLFPTRSSSEGTRTWLAPANVAGTQIKVPFLLRWLSRDRARKQQKGGAVTRLFNYLTPWRLVSAGQAASLLCPPPASKWQNGLGTMRERRHGESTILPKALLLCHPFLILSQLRSFQMVIFV